jgi:hypothetical protein
MEFFSRGLSRGVYLWLPVEPKPSRISGVAACEDDPAPHLTSDPDMVTEVPFPWVPNERRLGELGEPNVEIPYLVPKLEQERPRLGKIVQPPQGARGRVPESGEPALC